MIPENTRLQIVGLTGGIGSGKSAAADAFATALLMARLLPEARRQGAPTFGDMQKLARQAKWLH